MHLFHVRTKKNIFFTGVQSLGKELPKPVFLVAGLEKMESCALASLIAAGRVLHSTLLG